MTVARLIEILEDIDDKTKEVVITGAYASEGVLLDVEEQEETILLHSDIMSG